MFPVSFCRANSFIFHNRTYNVYLLSLNTRQSQTTSYWGQCYGYFFHKQLAEILTSFTKNSAVYTFVFKRIVNTLAKSGKKSTKSVLSRERVTKSPQVLPT
jgi:hypothetical protein